MFLKDEECFVVFRNMFRTFKLKVAKVGPWLSKTGSYTFQLDSDDGSRMYLEGLMRNAESRRKQGFAWRNVCKSENATEPHWFHIVFKSPHAAGGHAKRHGTSMAISNYYQKIGIWRAFVKCPCRRWNHRSRSLDQIVVYILSAWMDLNGCLFGFLFVPLQDFPYWGWLQGNQPSRACDTSKAIQQADAERTLWDQAQLAIFVRCKNKEKCRWNKSPFNIGVVLYMLYSNDHKWAGIWRIILSSWGSLYFTDISESFSPGWSTSRTPGILRVQKVCRLIPYG